ncbi:hypothetical protein PLEOSDRAFT_1078452 [Pleurotus ostreatus PC15]|uniref:Uncharacterized protein n=1 Tax=Pleurotus ostreatus (strain PC15) TaxID=1137138 RepID=A0A067NBB3_PLEO1|nr:hypothetical protein PLEOSDRAFT_1078452 [Pleurotus ostreatus PC15]
MRTLIPWNSDLIQTRVVSRVSSATATQNNAASSAIPSSSKPPASGFRAPAHKHAHHLHSIPPREKSTRTLIIDHMLWVHGRTRFAQARAELGMTDRTGGPSSIHYTHRHRPENYEEDEQVGSDGEDVDHLKSRALRPTDDDEEDRIGAQDLALARSLRLRAEGLEKVVTAMLDQPPVTVHPVDDEDVFSPPTSPKLGPSKHPHVLPNGVRLRLSLGTMINDFFARQAPPPPYRHQQRMKDDKEIATPVDSRHHLPPALEKLSSISSSPASSDLPYHARPKPTDRVFALYTAGADPSTANAPPALRCPRHLHTSCEICVEAKSRTKLGQSGGGNRHSSYSKSPMVTHLTPGSTPQAWAPSPSVYTPSSSAYNLSYNPASSYTSTYPKTNSTSSLTGGGALSGWQDGSGIGSGLARPGVGGSCLRRKPALGNRQTESRSSGSTGAGNAKLSELIPRFMRLSALVALELGREMEEDRLSMAGSTSGSNQPSSFASSSRDRGGSMFPPTSPVLRRASFSSNAPPVPQTPNQASTSQSKTAPYAYALQPSREWYLLTSGLLTRAALEGYLTAGWRGVEAIECLLTVGLGMKAATSEDDHSKEGGTEDPSSKAFEDFDPDDLPALQDATRILFPSLRNYEDSAAGPAADGSQRPISRSPVEEEFANEMMDRMRRFYDIPTSTPDLSTHMEDLAWQYPAEPVERAAVRFCEAVSRWRGKPELETVRGTALTLDSLVHSSPISPNNQNVNNPNRTRVGTGSDRLAQPSKTMPSIEKYFLPPLSASNLTGEREVAWNRGNKRMRSPEDTRAGNAKRIHV